MNANAEEYVRLTEARELISAAMPKVTDEARRALAKAFILVDNERDRLNAVRA